MNDDLNGMQLFEESKLDEPKKVQQPKHQRINTF